MLEKFLLTFIPIFVAVDIIGLLPIYHSLVEGLAYKNQKKIVSQSVLTAFGASIGFLILGKILFNFLGITTNDFKIAGGLILLVISIRNILFLDKTSFRITSTVGVVPIGIPLIVGPAVLTTLILMLDLYGYILTTVALISNLLIVWLALTFCKYIFKILGDNFANALAKIFSIFLAAIAIMLIRVGIGKF